MAVVDAANYGLYESVYAEDGDCWVDASSALACTQACQAGLLAASTAAPTLEACWVDGNPDMRLVFPEPRFWNWTPSGSCDLDVGAVSSKFQATTIASEFETILRFSDYGYLPTTRCTESGWNFVCETIDFYYEFIDLSGAFQDEFRSGSLTIDYSNDMGDSTSCSYTGRPN
jgi:hypothetical protein